jgi:hypothetical protein
VLIKHRWIVALAVVMTTVTGCSKDLPHEPDPVRSWPRISVSDSRCGAESATRITDPTAITVTLPPAKPFTVGRIPAETWRRTPIKDLSWKLKFLGLSWMRPVAARAHTDNQPAVLTALVAQAVAFHKENPDTGREAEGWDEGTAMRRLETENCLYALTRSADLVPGMEADAAVQFSNRYYGPPHHTVHNHGLMANLQLIRAADLLHRGEWKKTALQRLAREAPKAFSPMGTSLEQSAQYQHVNAVLWAQAADQLETSPGSRDTAVKIRRTVDDAYRMLAWMTQPDGRLVQFGDSDEGKGRPLVMAGTQSVRDDVAGLVAGRWSWTDPKTTYYTVRYGPPRRAHGHRDQAGGVTFYAKGVRVLVGAGRHSYNRDDPFRTYQLTPQGENVAVPAPGFVTPAPAQVTVATFTPDRHSITVKDQLYLLPHTRTIDVAPDRMTVADSFESAQTWNQSWHLDPKWKPAGRSTGRLVFRHPNGRTLTVTTTGRFAGLRHGVTGADTAGWHFPSAGVRQPAYQITVHNNGPLCTTEFTVR